jgi:magnesium chelatase family protein
MALDGRLTPVAGVLPAAMGAMAQERGIICPAPCGGEAAWAGPERDFTVLAPPSLLALINHFKGSQVLGRPAPRLAENEESYPDLRDIKGPRRPPDQWARLPLPAQRELRPRRPA